MVRQASDKKLLSRFERLHKFQAQHKLLLEAERVKILLSSNLTAAINLSFIENDLRPEVDAEQFDKAVEPPIRQVIDEVRKVTKEALENPEVVYVTGGMSQSPTLMEALTNEFNGTAQIRALDSLSAVGSGLGIVSNGLSRNLNLDQFYKLGLSN